MFWHYLLDTMDGPLVITVWSPTVYVRPVLPHRLTWTPPDQTPRTTSSRGELTTRV